MSFFNILMAQKGITDEVYNFDATDVIDTTQSTWKNRKVAATPSKNILYNSSGLIPNDGVFTGGTFTPHFADGPNYVMTAAKVTTPNTVGGDGTSAFYKPFSSNQLPVGNYVFKCKIKSAVAGVPQLLKYAFTSLTTFTTFGVDDNWATLTINGTVSNAATSNYLLIGSQTGAGSQSFLIDELQFYSSTDTIPNYVDDGNDSHISKPFGIKTPINKNGTYITNSVLALHSPQYPVVKDWAAMTVLFAVNLTADTSQAIFSTIADTYLGTTANSLYITFLNGEMSFSGATVLRPGKLNNSGFVVLGFSFDSTTTSAYINEVLSSSRATGLSSIKAQIFSIAGRLPSSSPVPLLGDLAFYRIWDRKLTSTEWYKVVAGARMRLTGMSATQKVKNWYFAEGDSITVAFGAPQGESYAYQMATTLLTGNEYLGHVNLAVSGNTLAFPEARLSGNMLVRIAEAQKGGGKAIVSMLIGRNDNATLISTAAVDAYWIRLRTYYRAIRATGAKMIAITCLPAGSAAVNGGASSNWETYRNYLNSIIRANPSEYDALADFGNPSVSIMGDVATADDSTYYDPAVANPGIHPMPAGHTILKGIIQPIIQSFL